jgi:hypothetical protein
VSREVAVTGARRRGIGGEGLWSLGKDISGARLRGLKRGLEWDGAEWMLMVID